MYAAQVSGGPLGSGGGVTDWVNFNAAGLPGEGMGYPTGTGGRLVNNMSRF